MSRPSGHLRLEQGDAVHSPRIILDVTPEAAILIVDDVSDIVEEMIQMLELLDLGAVGAHSIDAAIAQLGLHPQVRVVVCDLRLPGESGTTILKRIEADEALCQRDIAYLFMTGDADQARSVAALPNGAVLTKPINPRILIETIVALLDRKVESR